MTTYMALPWDRMRLSCSTASFWSAMTVPAPATNTPIATIVRFIDDFSFENPIANDAAIPLPRNHGCLSSDAPPLMRTNPAAAFYSLRLGAVMSKAVLPLALADRDPDTLGGRRHVDVVDLVLAPQPFDDGVDHGRTGADRAGLSRALDAHRVGLAGNVVGLEVE